MNTVSIKLAQEAQQLYKDYKGLGDTRLVRSALALEELAELLEALAQRDELATLDAIADIDYINQGHASCWDLPLDEAFWEVHRSNMSKGSGAKKDGSDPMNGKGEGFTPPDLQKILEAYNARKV